MDAISNTDRFVILLRQKLAKRAETKELRRTEKTVSRAPAGRDGIRAISGRAARAGANDKILRRTIIEQLLADRFGSALINEARFQEIVDQVTELMASDPSLSSLFTSVVAEIRES
jgi:hypothetical protein